MSVIQSTGLLPTSVLIFHPDPLIGMMIDEILTEAGFGNVCFVTSVDGAAKAMRENHFDAAILGVNNHNEELLPIARHLKRAGMPFVVCGALSKLPTAEGLDLIPNVSALADADEFAGALSAVGVALNSRPTENRLSC